MNQTICKKNFFIFFIIIFIFITLSHNTAFCTTKELSTIADKVNFNNPVADHLKEHYSSNIVANVDNNKIILTHNNSPFSDNNIQKVEFILENNILSTTITEKEDTTEFLSELSMAWILVDCIGQIDGYEKGAVYKTLAGTGDAYKDYSLNNDGFEIKSVANNTNIKIDLSRKFLIKKDISENNNTTQSELPQTGSIHNYIILMLSIVLIICIFISYYNLIK